MAKILVADDNSNVQKTVALALADLGVEVVAVNNGDAAVKKLPDVLPDLVLADIFMPVRNGYEVCEYIKKDSRFARVPVVLLVGAFDPLDEREAQRVGADGILKKPFVPPDPLIAMVKTLLDRVLGDRLVSVAISKPAVSMQGKAGGTVVAEQHPATPETSPESAEEEFHTPIDRVSFGEGERPIAFGQLLEPPAKEIALKDMAVVEPVDDEQILTSSRDASLGDPIFWKTEEPEPETHEENPEPEADAVPGFPMHDWKFDEEAAPRATGADFPEPVEPFELVREEKDEDGGKTSTIVELSPLLGQDAASQASLTVETAKPEDLAANPIEWMASVLPPTEKTPEATPEWNAVISEAADDANTNSQPVTPEPAASVVAPVSVSVPTPEPPPSPTLVQPPMKRLDQSAEDTARSIPLQEWADLATSLRTKSIERVAEKAAPSFAPVAQPPAVTATQDQTASMNSAPPVSKPSSQSAEDTARSIPMRDWADMTASLRSKLNEPVAEKPKPAPAPLAQASDASVADAPSASASVAQIPAATAANVQPAAESSASPAPPDPALVEAVVQRVLEKMRPQVVDIITKEFLRPVVQALVHREITKR